MKRFKPNLPLGIGLILYAVAQILSRYTVALPELFFRMMILSALALELWGIILIARSPEMKNSKLRRWKLRLIGKEPKIN